MHQIPIVVQICHISSTSKLVLRSRIVTFSLLESHALQLAKRFCLMNIIYMRLYTLYYQYITFIIKLTFSAAVIPGSLF